MSAPRRPRRDPRPTPDRRGQAVPVACGLLVIALLLALGAFVGVRMLLDDGADEPGGSAASVAQQVPPAAQGLAEGLRR